MPLLSITKEVEESIMVNAVTPIAKATTFRVIEVEFMVAEVEETLMAQIIGHTTSHSAWLTLEIFSSLSRARIMQLRLELQTLKKGSMYMMDFLMKLKSISDSLAAIGEIVTGQDQIMDLLVGLGADYNAIVTAINSRNERISLEVIHSIFLSYKH